MAQAVGPVASLGAARVRSRRWKAAGTDLQTVIDQLLRMEAELRLHDAAGQDHPHPRNCVLNLIAAIRGEERIKACDTLLTELATAHPMRAILLHLTSGAGGGLLAAAITVQAHQLLNGFPVQREQVLLEVGQAPGDHLSSLVEPLLVADIPTFVWWSGHAELDQQRLVEVAQFSDVLVVDSAEFERPAEALLQLASVTGGSLGVSDFGWARLQPWRDSIGQFFAPVEREQLLAGLLTVRCESAGAGPRSRCGSALLAGWLAAELGWRFIATPAAAESATETLARTADGGDVQVALVSVPPGQLSEGELTAVHLAGRAGGKPFELSIERNVARGSHVHVTIQLGADTLHQRLTMPRLTDSDLLLQALWANRRDLVFERALTAASVLLEPLR